MSPYKRSLSSTWQWKPHFEGPGPVRHSKSLTFINVPWARPAHLNPSILSTGPGPPNPSLLLARPSGVTPKPAKPPQTLALLQPALPRVPTERPPPISPGLAPSLFGKPSYALQAYSRSGPLRFEPLFNEPILLLASLFRRRSQCGLPLTQFLHPCVKQ